MNVAPVLQATLSPDPALRLAAENEVYQLSITNETEFFTALIEFASSPKNSVADCQSSLLVLKNCIVRRWSPGFEQFTGPPLSHETRKFLRNALLELLKVLNNNRVRSACASVISRIGGLEFPDQWPDLISKATELLFTPSGSLSAAGGLILFKELLVEVYREEDFMVQGESVLNHFLYLLTSTENFEQKKLAIACFHDCMTFLLMGDDTQLTELDVIAQRVIPPWITAFEHHLTVYITSRELVGEIANAIKEVDSAFPQILGPCLPSLFNTLLDLLETHMSSLDEDTISNLAYILDLCLQNSNVRHMHFRTADEVERFTNLLVRMATISENVAEDWVDDYNDFVTCEMELETIETSARSYAAMLVSTVNNAGILNCLLTALPESSGYVLESVLFVIHNWLSQVEIEKFAAHINPKGFQTFLSSLNFEPNESQIVVARKICAAFIAAKHSGDILSNDIKLKLLTHGLNSDLSHADSELVIFEQLRAVQIGSSMFPQVFKQYQTTTFELIYKLLESAEEDTPLFLTDIYSAVLKLDYSCASANNQVLELLFSLARKNSADVDLTAQVLDIVGDLLDLISSEAIVSFILQPVLQTIQDAQAYLFEYSSDLYFALEIANAVFEHKEIGMSDSEQKNMLQGFYSVITTTNDSQILQVASFAYAALVKNLGTSVHLEVAGPALQVAAKLLDPELDDSAALASGQLVRAIIDKFGSELGSVQTELIIACANRLSSAQNALLVETLVMVFCELVLRNAQAVIDILCSNSMLEPVINQWLPAFEVVRGSDEIRKNVLAFQKLVDLNDSRINFLQVKDEPIREEGIMTRRRTKNLKYTMCSLPLKIVKIFVKELSQSPSSKDMTDALGQPTIPNKQSGEDDSDWDDEFALNDEGEITDFRTFKLILDWFKNLSQQRGVEFFSMLNAHERKVLMDISK